MTAENVWRRDGEKNELLKSAGYEVEVVWENTNKRFRC
jgi:G:T-mismatch repair DNA endonuclease (very short patch repair protein)